MLSKYEVIGVFLSIGAMALVLAFFRFGVPDLAVFSDNPGEDQGAVVVVARDSETNEPSLKDAITEAATKNGELKKLIIDDVRIGTVGDAVKEGDTITVNYEGRTQDGIPFDSSYERGEPFTFAVGAGKVIEGWEKGLVGMKVGGQRVLVIPPDMAYGNAQVGPIAPNSILVFTVELLVIE